MAKMQVSWDMFVYPDRSEVAGEIFHVEARTAEFGGVFGEFVEVATGTTDAAFVEFDVTLPQGATIQVRVRANVNGEYGPYSEVVQYVRPFGIPVPVGVKLRLVA